MELSHLIKKGTKVIDIYDVIKNDDNEIIVMIDLDTNFHVDATINATTKKVINAEFISQSDMDTIQNATNIVTPIYRVDTDANALNLITEVLRNNLDDEYLSELYCE